MNEDLTDEELKDRLYVVALEHWKEANRLQAILVEDHKKLRRSAQFWEETARLHVRNAEFYRNLLIRCGQALGTKAYTIDTGEVSHDVRVAKIPELVENLVNSLNT